MVPVVGSIVRPCGNGGVMVNKADPESAPVIIGDTENSCARPKYNDVSRYDALMLTIVRLNVAVEGKLPGGLHVTVNFVLGKVVEMVPESVPLLSSTTSGKPSDAKVGAIPVKLRFVYPPKMDGRISNRG